MARNAVVNVKVKVKPKNVSKKSRTAENEWKYLAYFQQSDWIDRLAER